MTRYKLIFDECLADVPGQEIEARLRMTQCGEWQDEGWWEPRPWQQERARERIEREGFDIVSVDHA